MIKWIKELFKPPVDRTEMKIREQFQFMFDDYGFSFANKLRLQAWSSAPEDSGQGMFPSPPRDKSIR